MERRVLQWPTSALHVGRHVCLGSVLLITAGAPFVSATDQGIARQEVVAAGDFRYTLSARIRPLLFWVGRDDVGEARVRLTSSPDGARTYEVLIGSDPRRAPLRVNRWGYLAEHVTPTGVTLVGVMTESSEETFEQARTRVSTTADTRRFKAIRAQIGQGEARACVLIDMLAGEPTYRDLEAVLARFPASASGLRRVTIPDGAARGFLSGVADLLDANVQAHAVTRPPASGLRRPFVHGTRIYTLVLRTSRRVAGAGTEVCACPSAIESAFEVRDDAGHAVSQFRITYAADGPLAGVPLRIVYRPRWWLEAELVITRPAE